MADEKIPPWMTMQIAKGLMIGGVVILIAGLSVAAVPGLPSYAIAFIASGSVMPLAFGFVYWRMLRKRDQSLASEASSEKDAAG